MDDISSTRLGCQYIRHPPQQVMTWVLGQEDRHGTNAMVWGLEGVSWPLNEWNFSDTVPKLSAIVSKQTKNKPNPRLCKVSPTCPSVYRWALILPHSMQLRRHQQASTCVRLMSMIDDEMTVLLEG
jgi:hypothetical protein